MSGNQLDTTCIPVVTEVSINCSSLNIADLTGIGYFTNLDTLDCSKNQLSFLPPLPDSLKYLLSSENNLSSLPVLPAGLQKLDCGKNQLSTLPVLPLTLRELYCGDDSLVSLPTLPPSLRNLFCFGNKLGQLPALPEGLLEVYCYSNQLTSLPALNDSLMNLDCSGNPHLTAIPTLPTSKFLYLNCSNDSLTSLPVLPASMTVLTCFSNQLTSLPVLPDKLSSLDCSINPISALPVLPAGMMSLNCSFIGLPVLPALPDSLEGINCAFNTLTYLPVLPRKLIFLDCSNNNLSYLPEFPESLQDIFCGTNPLLCLPRLRQLANIDFSNTAVECIPSYNPLVSSNPPLSSFTLCDEFNKNACDYYQNIAGDTHLDTDSNCVLNPTDTLQKNVKLFLSTAAGLVQQTFTSTTGIYSFKTKDFNTYSISADTSELPFTVFCPVDDLYQTILTPADTAFLYNDFALRCKEGFDLAAWSIVAEDMLPGKNSLVNVSAGDLANFTGVHCAKGIAGTVELLLNGPITYVAPKAGARTPSNITGNAVTWGIADFDSVDFINDFNIVIHTDENTTVNKQVCINLKVSTNGIENKPQNNTLEQCFVTGPKSNYKEAYPSGNTDTSEEWITYTIYFHNTGRDTVQNLKIIDTLDDNFDVSSFQLLAYTHNNSTVVNEYRVVQFNFPNLRLFDSISNDVLSRGYIQYRVKMKKNIPMGTQIINTAHIYFDGLLQHTTSTKNIIAANPLTSISTLVLNQEKAAAAVFPNPVIDKLYIAPYNFQPDRIALFDISGQRISEFKYVPAIDISSLVPGIYFMEIKNDEVLVRKRIVKL